MTDERELRFTCGVPLLAWRLFRVRRLPDGYALCAPMIHSPAPPPWQPGFTVARCLSTITQRRRLAVAAASMPRSKARLTRFLDICSILPTTAILGPTPRSPAAVECSWMRGVYAARRPWSCSSLLPRGPSRAPTSGCGRPRFLRRATAFVSAQVMPHRAGSPTTRAGGENRLDRYGHLCPEADTALRDRLDALYVAGGQAGPGLVIELPRDRSRPQRGPATG
jgi:hypothetical protein